MLSAASKKKKPVFVASTSEVYGKSADLPFREDGDLLLGPTYKGRWSYACSKAIDEFLALAYWKERGLPTVIGRLFNTVGPRQTGRYGMVVPNFVGQALAGQPLTVFGDGTQSRCFCHVSDVVRALADLMERDDLYGEIFNIGTQAEITITRPGREGPRGRRLDVGDHLHPLRRGLRARVRGHAPPHARHREDPRHHRLGAASHARPDRGRRA